MRYKQLAVKLFVIAIFASVAYLNIGGCGSSEGPICDLEFFGLTAPECFEAERSNVCSDLNCAGLSETVCEPCQVFDCLICPQQPGD